MVAEKGFCVGGEGRAAVANCLTGAPLPNCANRSGGGVLRGTVVLALAITGGTTRGATTGGGETGETCRVGGFDAMTVFFLGAITGGGASFRLADWNPVLKVLLVLLARLLAFALTSAKPLTAFSPKVSEVSATALPTNEFSSELGLGFPERD